ncbi:MAG TPA: universal stress protein [Rhodospirillaceae bacterium]|nr:universal stress protein [Rhodospirillaceae bacterium]
MKDILVQIDGDEIAEARLRTAVALAKRLGARLVGLFARVDSDTASITARRASSHLQAAAKIAAEQFRRAVDGSGLESEWLQLPHGEPEFVVEETAVCARYVDLVMLGQWSREHSHVPAEYVQEVLNYGGRPVLMVPRNSAGAAVGDQVGVAWNGSREASRALHDALPLLAKASQVSLITLRETEGRKLPSDLPQLDITKALTAHGIAAKVERIIDEDLREVGVMDSLLLRAAELKVDLLVMGANSGGGLMRGSGTRYMLRSVTMPLLLSC